MEDRKRSSSRLLFESWARHWKRIPRAVRKPLILFMGTFIVVVGLILVPLPGPGWAIVFAGLALLATEFAVAERMRNWLILQLKQWIHHAQKLRNGRRKHKRQ